MGRWDGAPRSARVVATVAVLVLAYGTAVHAVQVVAARGTPYADLPGWLRGYFVSLTLLDPAAGVTAGRVGQAVTTLLALAVSVVTPSLWQAASARTLPGSPPDT